MKFIFFMFALTISSIGFAKQSVNLNLSTREKCFNSLLEIVNRNISLKGVRKDEISFNFFNGDEKNEKIIQLVLKSDGVNSENVFANIRFNLLNKNMYDITYDEENMVPMKIEKKNYFINNKCIN